MTTPAEHYDSLTVPTLAERASGQTYHLKKLHNEFKRKVIEEHARSANMLIDIACGRGGDLNKWQAAGVKAVFGVDVSGTQIAEARRRAERCQGLHAQFSVTPPDLTVLRELPSRCADAVQCMFALNYFWGSLEDAAGLLSTASRLLVPGGVFFGVCASGEAVANFQAPLNTNTYSLERHWTSGPPARDFGAAYTLTIKDTVLDGVHPAPENLVKYNVLRNLAVLYGFQPVHKGFQPIDSSGLPTAEMRDISAINASFAFKKV